MRPSSQSDRRYDARSGYVAIFPEDNCTGRTQYSVGGNAIRQLVQIGLNACRGCPSRSILSFGLLIRSISTSYFYMKTAFTIGDRVRISTLGASRCARLAGKVGTIVGSSIYASSLQIRFDGNKSASTLHRDYLEVVAKVDLVE
jgi:hypothetical protein